MSLPLALAGGLLPLFVLEDSFSGCLQYQHKLMAQRRQAASQPLAVQNEADRRTSSATLNLYKGYDPAKEVKKQKRSEL